MTASESFEENQDRHNSTNAQPPDACGAGDSKARQGAHLGTVPGSGNVDEIKQIDV